VETVSVNEPGIWTKKPYAYWGFERFGGVNGEGAGSAGLMDSWMSGLLD
jgi:hypothetical protein